MVQRGVIDPPPDDVRQGLYDMRLAEELGIRPWELWTVPLQYVRNAKLRLEIEALQQQAASRKHAKQG